MANAMDALPSGWADELRWVGSSTRRGVDGGAQDEPAPSKPQPEPDTPDDPDNGHELPDVNPGSNPENPGDRPAVTEPGRPARVVARD